MWRKGFAWCRGPPLISERCTSMLLSSPLSTPPLSRSPAFTESRTGLRGDGCYSMVPPPARWRGWSSSLICPAIGRESGPRRRGYPALSGAPMQQHLPQLGGDFGHRVGQPSRRDRSGRGEGNRGRAWLLGHADIELRADVYRSLGLQLAYRREGDAEYVRALASIHWRGPRACRRGCVSSGHRQG